MPTVSVMPQESDHHDFKALLVENEIEYLRRFIEILKYCDVEKDDEFAIAVSTAVAGQIMDPKQFASAAGVAVSTISRWQRGLSVPPATLLKSGVIDTIARHAELKLENLEADLNNIFRELA